VDDKENNMTRPAANLLTAQAIIGINALGYMYDKELSGNTTPTPASELAAALNMGLSHVQHAIIPLRDGGIIVSEKGKYGGHRIATGALARFTLVETLLMLGQNIPAPSGGERPSDRLTDGIYDILNVSLEEFLQ
jgi:DNA-binding IscR family transcriptional regulator